MKRSLYRYNDRAVRGTRILRIALCLVLYTTLVVALTSCKTAQPVVSNQQSVISNQYSTHRDSVVIRDSIVVRYKIGVPNANQRSVCGGESGSSGCFYGAELHLCNPLAERVDTIYCDRWHDRWQVQRVERTDTLYRDREVTTQLPPERYIPPWAWWCLGFCIALAILLIIRIILRFYLRR